MITYSAWNYGTAVMKLVGVLMSSQIDTSQLDARLNFPHESFPATRYLFILVQYIFYVQLIRMVLKHAYI